MEKQYLVQFAFRNTNNTKFCEFIICGVNIKNKYFMKIKVAEILSKRGQNVIKKKK